MRGSLNIDSNYLEEEQTFASGADTDLKKKL